MPRIDIVIADGFLESKKKQAALRDLAYGVIAQELRCKDDQGEPVDLDPLVDCFGVLQVVPEMFLRPENAVFVDIKALPFHDRDNNIVERLSRIRRRISEAHAGVQVVVNYGHIADEHWSS